MPRYVWSSTGSRWVETARDAAVRPRLTLINRDAGFAAGVRSMADGRLYGSRRDYDEHLRRHGMVEVGNTVLEPAPVEPPTALPALRRGGR